MYAVYIFICTTLRAIRSSFDAAQLRRHPTAALRHTKRTGDTLGTSVAAIPATHVAMIASTAALRQVWWRSPNTKMKADTNTAGMRPAYFTNSKNANTPLVTPQIPRHLETPISTPSSSSGDNRESNSQRTPTSISAAHKTTDTTTPPEPAMRAMDPALT